MSQSLDLKAFKAEGKRRTSSLTIPTARAFNLVGTGGEGIVRTRVHSALSFKPLTSSRHTNLSPTVGS